MCPNLCPRFRAVRRKSLRCKEAPVGIEPTNRGFADLCLTTWLRRRWKRKLATHYEFGKSSSANRLPAARLPELSDKPLGDVRERRIPTPRQHAKQRLPRLAVAIRGPRAERTPISAQARVSALPRRRYPRGLVVRASNTVYGSAVVHTPTRPAPLH